MARLPGAAGGEVGDAPGGGAPCDPRTTRKCRAKMAYVVGADSRRESRNTREGHRSRVRQCRDMAGPRPLSGDHGSWPRAASGLGTCVSSCLPSPALPGASGRRSPVSRRSASRRNAVHIGFLSHDRRDLRAAGTVAPDRRRTPDRRHCGPGQRARAARCTGSSEKPSFPAGWPWDSKGEADRLASATRRIDHAYRQGYAVSIT